MHQIRQAAALRPPSSQQKCADCSRKRRICIFCSMPVGLKRATLHLQVPRILNPVVLVVDGLPGLCKDKQVKAYVDSAFGSVEQCR